ncbi:MAG: mechanosensitive ion channel protein MscS [Candidatus Aminicenantes bacterium RBG_13_64_14]|nr:MAG: mechanosensitive ion channel protein MscS [Candidatus Aminicenantes bacterium RBG_13_64_14]
MVILERIFYHNTLGKWLIALIVAAAVWLVLMILRRVVYRKVLAASRKTASPLDSTVALLIRKIKTWFSLAVAVYAGSLVLTLPRHLTVALGKLALLALLLQGAVWGSEIITFWVTQSRKKRGEGEAADAAVLGLLNFAVRAVLWTGVLLLALDNLGVHVTTLITGIGIGGVAIALAIQNILGDLFASLSIILDKPFMIGDFIIVDDFLGTVEHIGLKTTRLRSLSGEQLVFANSDLLKSRIRNYKRMAERRIVFSIGVVYQTAPEKLAGITGFIRDIIEGQPQARFDRAHFKGFGSSSLDFEIVYWVTSPDYNLYMDIQQAINLALFRRLQSEGIEFAYPTQTLFLERQEAGGRSAARTG